MKLFLNSDSHGRDLFFLEGDADLVLVVGDFAKGDKLREVVFGNGDIADAKKEIIESAKSFLSKLPEHSIVTSGNVEKLCLEDVSKIAKECDLYFLDNKVLEINGLKIIGLKFFMEEWWARKVYPNDLDKINRAKMEEEDIRKFLSENLDADIVLSHLPPYEVLDKDPNPPEILPKNYTSNCGSKILLDYIEKNNPRLVVCGHIHFPGEVMIGESRVINPGEKRIIEI